MANREETKPIIEETQKLLDQQTIVILGAVDEKLQQTEARVNQKIEKLTTSIDKFLKQTTDLDSEFTAMKEDIKRVKEVLRDRLGVALD